VTARCLASPVLSATTKALKPAGSVNPALSKSAFGSGIMFAEEEIFVNEKIAKMAAEKTRTEIKMFFFIEELF
jgi:hypothetical protein